MRPLSVLVLAFIAQTTAAVAQDVYVDGYIRSDGTYVRPHVRSAPDASQWNNYGPSQNSQQLLNPNARDYDSDGLSNRYDYNDDGDGFLDDYDANPYGSNGSNW